MEALFSSATCVPTASSCRWEWQG